MIEIKHLQKSFDRLTVLKDVNAVIQKGEVISIIGPSGTGKSTLLRCLNLLERPTSGEILWNGNNLLDPHADIASLRMKMGMVFQQFNLFPHLTVLENITVSPRTLLKQSRPEAEKRAMELLKMVGLDNKAFALPTELSGGQQQRVAIARTLAMNPEVILLDEPTSALDPTMVDEVLNVISDLAKTGITMLIVTHEMRFARNVSSRIFYMDEGIIYEDGTPQQIFEAPEKLKTIAFIKRLDYVCLQINRNTFDTGELYKYGQSMMCRFKLDQESFQRIVKIVRTVLTEVIFPVTENVVFRFGFQKDENTYGFSMIWDGETVNPLKPGSDAEKFLTASVKKIEFKPDYAGHSRLIFFL